MITILKAVKEREGRDSSLVPWIFIELRRLFISQMGNNTRESAYIEWVINLILNWFNDPSERTGLHFSGVVDRRSYVIWTPGVDVLPIGP